jgi:tetratricopeptide (TPR) repeat protein
MARLSLICRILTFGLFVLTMRLPRCWAQSVTPEQQSSCDRHHETNRCQQLVKEFYADHGLLAANPSAPLDKPWGDTVALSNKIAPKAILLQLSADLKAQADQAAQRALQTISTSAAVTQVGGSPSTSGSTNLVTKPTTTDFLSMAAESGAFTDTLNGNALTLQANALGLTKYLSNNPVFARWDSKLADTIQPLDFTISLNVAQSGSSTVTTTGSANSSTPPSIASVVLPTNNASFGSFSASYVIYRPYNPQDKTFLANWRAAVTANQGILNSTGSAIKEALDKLLTADVVQAMAENLATAQSDWHQAGAAAEKLGKFDAFVAAYETYDNAVIDYILSRPDAPKNASDLSKALDAFNAAAYIVLNQARGTPLATVSYTYSTPSAKPATHDFTVVLSELFRGGKDIRDAIGNKTGQKDETRTFLSGAQLTGNFTASIYAKPPAGATYGRFRDVQLSAEFDKPFGGTIAEPRGVFSVAGYGQFQYDPTVLNITPGNMVPGTNITLPDNAQVLLGTSGWLGVAQGKIVFNLSKGLSIPVALKWSNKTDLLKGSDVRAQLGLSYDLSALSKLISTKE